nr:hypothetical protein [Tanacetum cinerariifolium]
YVVPTGRVVVPTGRADPAGRAVLAVRTCWSFLLATLKSKNRNGKGCNSKSQYEQQKILKPAAMSACDAADIMLRSYDDGVLEFLQVDI